MREKLLHCSFCGKSQREVAELIAAPNNEIYICNECIGLSKEIITEGRAQKQSRLTIYFKDGRYKWVQNKNRSTWDKFLKWFYSRDNSARFRIPHDRGHFGIVKDAVSCYTINEVDQDNEKEEL